MTLTGQQLDELARQRAADVAAAIAARAMRDVHHEHTREIVRTDLPDDIKSLILEAVADVQALRLEVATLRSVIADYMKDAA